MDGSHQIKMAELYTYHHVSAFEFFKIQLHKEDNGLVLPKIKSLFKKAKVHDC
jgi:hypothetical protein